MEKFFLKKIEAWVLIGCSVFGCLATVAFMWVVKTEVEKPTRLGKLGQAAIIVADFPNYVRSALKNPFRNPFLVNDEPLRFDGLSGFSAEYELGTKPDYPYLLISYMNPDKRIGITELLDLNTGQQYKIQLWDVEKLWATTDIVSEHFYLSRDFPNYRFLPGAISLSVDGTFLTSNYSPLIKSDECMHLSIINDENLYHHSLEKDADGNFWLPSLIEPVTNLLKVKGQREDGITKINAQGTVIFSKSIFEIIFENQLASYVFAVNGKYQDLDPFHLNDIQPVLKDGPYWKKGDVFLSLRNRSMLMLYRPAINKVIWYKSGITSQQHDIDIVSYHEITIFDNNMGGAFNVPTDPGNRVALYDFQTDKVTYPFKEATSKINLKTRYAGGSEVFLENTIMIEESNYGRIVGLSEAKNSGWTYINRHGSNNSLMNIAGSSIVSRKTANKFLEKRSNADCAKNESDM
jgi:hypothetical protein